METLALHELQQLCRMRELPVAGKTKSELVQQLTQPTKPLEPRSPSPKSNVAEAGSPQRTLSPGSSISEDERVAGLFPTDYSLLDSSALLHLCKERRLDISGSRTDVIVRLQALDPRWMRAEDLKARCRNLGLFRSASLEEMTSRVMRSMAGVSAKPKVVSERGHRFTLRPETKSAMRLTLVEEARICALFPGDYEQLMTSELQDICKDRGIEAGHATRKELVGRLSLVDPRNMNTHQLRKICVALKVSTNGTKQDLIERVAISQARKGSKSAKSPKKSSPQKRSTASTAKKLRASPQKPSEPTGNKQAARLETIAAKERWAELIAAQPQSSGGSSSPESATTSHGSPQKPSQELSPTVGFQEPTASVPSPIETTEPVRAGVSPPQQQPDRTRNAQRQASEEPFTNTSGMGFAELLRHRGLPVEGSSEPIVQNIKSSTAKEKQTAKQSPVAHPPAAPPRSGSYPVAGAGVATASHAQRSSSVGNRVEQPTVQARAQEHIPRERSNSSGPSAAEPLTTSRSSQPRLPTPVAPPDHERQRRIAADLERWQALMSPPSTKQSTKDGQKTQNIGREKAPASNKDTSKPKARRQLLDSTNDTDDKPTTPSVPSEDKPTSPPVQQTQAVDPPASSPSQSLAQAVKLPAHVPSQSQTQVVGVVTRTRRLSSTASMDSDDAPLMPRRPPRKRQPLDSSNNANDKPTPSAPPENRPTSPPVPQTHVVDPPASSPPQPLAQVVEPPANVPSQSQTQEAGVVTRTRRLSSTTSIDSDDAPLMPRRPPRKRKSPHPPSTQLQRLMVELEYAKAAKLKNNLPDATVRDVEGSKTEEEETETEAGEDDDGDAEFDEGLLDPHALSPPKTSVVERAPPTPATMVELAETTQPTAELEPETVAEIPVPPLPQVPAQAVVESVPSTGTAEALPLVVDEEVSQSAQPQPVTRQLSVSDEDVTPQSAIDCCYVVYTIQATATNSSAPPEFTFYKAYASQSPVSAHVRQLFYENHPEGWSETVFQRLESEKRIRADDDANGLLKMSLQAPYPTWKAGAVPVPTVSAEITQQRECFLVCSIRTYTPSKNKDAPQVECHELFPTKEAANAAMVKVFYDGYPWESETVASNRVVTPPTTSSDGLYSMCAFNSDGDSWQVDVCKVSGGDAPPQQEWFMVYNKKARIPSEEAFVNFYPPVQTKAEANELANKVFSESNKQNSATLKQPKTQRDHDGLMSLSLRANGIDHVVGAIAVPPDSYVCEKDPASGVVIVSTTGYVINENYAVDEPKMTLETLVAPESAFVNARVEAVFYERNPYGWSREDFRNHSDGYKGSRAEVVANVDSGLLRLSISPLGLPTWAVCGLLITGGQLSGSQQGRRPLSAQSQQRERSPVAVESEPRVLEICYSAPPAVEATGLQKKRPSSSSSKDNHTKRKRSAVPGH